MNRIRVLKVTKTTITDHFKEVIVDDLFIEWPNDKDISPMVFHIRSGRYGRARDMKNVPVKELRTHPKTRLAVCFK